MSVGSMTSMTFKLATADHRGLCTYRLPNGQFADDPDLPCNGAQPPASVAAACDCGWQSTREWPRTEAGYADAFAEWSDEHIRPLIVALAWRAAVARVPDVMTFVLADEKLLPWPDDKASHLVSITRIQALCTEAESYQRAEVRSALEKGASWLEVSDALGMTEQSARERFENARPQ